MTASERNATLPSPTGYAVLAAPEFLAVGNCHTAFLLGSVRGGCGPKRKAIEVYYCVILVTKGIEQFSPHDYARRVENLLYQKAGNPVRSDLYRDFDPEEVHRALAKEGETLKHLWKKYNVAGAVNGRRPLSYRQFYRRYANWADNTKVTFRRMFSGG